MKNEENNWIVEQIKQNLFVILVGAGMIYTTFHNADTNTARDITEINKKLDKLDAIYIRLCRLEANAQLGECK
jgi:hypothetical protein